MSKAKKYDSALMQRVRARITPELASQIDRHMNLAVQIHSALQQRGLTNQEFAFMMGKKPSEISRWLSGTHNFTTETLWEIERVLNIQLLTSSPAPNNGSQIPVEELAEFIKAEVFKALTTYYQKTRQSVQ